MKNSMYAAGKNAKNNLVTVQINHVPARLLKNGKAGDETPVKVLDFFVTIDNRRYYLFTQKFSGGVYKYFMQGRYTVELRRHVYDRNKRLDQTVDRLPGMIAYVTREIAA